jgi:hypothetical protein
MSRSSALRLGMKRSTDRWLFPGVMLRFSSPIIIPVGIVVFRAMYSKGQVSSVKKQSNDEVK